MDIASALFDKKGISASFDKKGISASFDKNGIFVVFGDCLQKKESGVKDSVYP